MRPASDAATRKADKEAILYGETGRLAAPWGSVVGPSPLRGGEPVKGTPLTRAQEVGCVPHPTRPID